MRTATVEYESARSPVPQEISGPVLNQFEHPKKDKTKTWIYRESEEKVVIVLHGSDARSEVRQTSETMGEAMAAALAKGSLVGNEPGHTLGDMRQTQLNNKGDVSISIEGESETLAEVYD
jgi:hypothetical protein